MRDSDLASYWSGWSEPTVTFSASSLSGFNFQEDTARVLGVVGLPAQAAPFLSFNQSSSEFQSFDTYLETEDAKWKRLVTIGADSAGNPLVLDTGAHDQVLLLDHDNDFTVLPVNQSLRALLTCLVSYNQFVSEVVASRGSYADFTDEQFITLQTSLLASDRPSVEANGFWHYELAGLLVSRKRYRQ